MTAQERGASRYVKLLVPIQAPVAASGAHDTRWQTKLWLRNDGSSTLDAFPLSRDCISSVSCFQSVRGVPAFQPLQTGVHTNPPSPYHLGIVDGPGFLYVEREKLSQLSAQLHVVDTSRVPNVPAQIPIVPVESFFTSTRSILGVTPQSGTRITLRVYADERIPGAELALRVHYLGPRVLQEAPWIVFPQLIAERRIAFPLDLPPDRCGFPIGCPDGVSYIPAMIQLDLLALMPEVAIATAQPHGIRIELEPLTPGLRYWPMVTVTENSTSNVSVYTVGGW